VFCPKHIDGNKPQRYTWKHENATETKRRSRRTGADKKMGGFQEIEAKACRPSAGGAQPVRRQNAGKYRGFSAHQPFAGYPVYKAV
jgi:hypothetical protein